MPITRRTLLPAMLCIASGAALADQQSNPANDETRAVVAEMLADAETRSSMLNTNAGHDAGGFFISDGENFKLVIGGDIKFRHNLVFGDQLDNVPDRGYEGGFQNALTRLRFGGYIYDPALYYYIQGRFGITGTFSLLDAYAGYKFDNGWSVQWGQMKVPFNREWLVDDRFQLAADRSITDAVFRSNRGQGIQAIYQQEEFKVQVMFSDGFSSQNTDFNTIQSSTSVFQGAKGGGTSDYSVAARAEFKLSGEWSQFKDFTSMPGSDQAVMFGVAADIEGTGEDRLAPGPPATDSNVLFAWTADASIEGDGWNAFAAFTGYHTDNLASYADYGWVVQGGWFIPDSNWELFARFDQIIPDNDSGARGLTTGTSFNTVTVGTNWYMHGHASKFTFQVQWFLNGDPALLPLSGAGSSTNTQVPWLANGGEDNEVALTFQWQIVF